MQSPMFSKALRTEVIDGRVYVDLEQLAQLIFDTSNESTVVATRTKDPALGIMALGIAQLGKALDGALTLQQESHGLMEPPRQCGVSKPHPEHLRMQGRKKVRCPGVDEAD